MSRCKIAFGVYTDGPWLKIAQVSSINGILQVDKLSRVPLPKKEASKEEYNLETKLYKSLEDNLNEFPDLESENLDAALPSLDDLGLENTDRTESRETTARELVQSLPMDKGRIGVACQDEKVMFYVLPDMPDNKIEKVIRTEIITDEEQQNQRFTWTHIHNSDNTLLVIVHMGDPQPLEWITEYNNAMGNRRSRFGLLDTSEVTLMNLMRAQYQFVDDEPVLVLYLGYDYKVGIIMKNGEFAQRFPIVVSSSDTDNVRQSIFSKVSLEQDTGHIPYTKNVILVGDYADDDDVEFFQSLAVGDEVFSRLAMPLFNLERDTSEEDSYLTTDVLLAQYAIPLGLAWKVLDPGNKAFYRTNLLPSYIVERQNSLKLSWHGFLLLVVLFLVTYWGTVENVLLISKKSELRNDINTMDNNINLNNKPLPSYDSLRTAIDTLQKKVSLIDTLMAGTNQWSWVVKKMADFTAANPVTWVQSLTGEKDKFSIIGYTTDRRNIGRMMVLYPNLGNLNVEEAQITNNVIWRFSMDFPLPNPPMSVREYLPVTDNDQVVGADLRESSQFDDSDRLKGQVPQGELDEYNRVYDAYLAHAGEKALSMADDFLKAKPDPRLAYLTLYIKGESLYNLNRYAQAKKIFEQVLTTRGSKTPDALMMLSNCYLQDDNQRQAAQLLQKLVNEFPQDELAPVAREKLKVLGD